MSASTSCRADCTTDSQVQVARRTRTLRRIQPRTVGQGGTLERHVGHQVLVITHGWVLDVVLRHVAGLSRTAVMHEKPKNGESVWAAVHERTIRARGPSTSPQPVAPAP